MGLFAGGWQISGRCGGASMLKDMKTRKHLKPGQMGTKRFVTQYGDALLCVRYRYDEKRCV
jgi:hypothetical protein